MELDKLYFDKNLSRNYQENPLKRGEKPCKEDLEYLYLQLNLTSKEICEIIGKSETQTRAYFREYRLKKTTEQKAECLKRTNLAKFGVDNPAKLQSVQDKMRATCLARYGVENGKQAECVKEKSRETCLEKYGVDNPAKSIEVKERMRKTNQERYGVDWVPQNPQIRQKQIDSMISKYSVKYPYQTDEFVQKAKDTCMTRYGADNIMRTQAGKKHLKDAIQKKYGVDNPAKCSEVQEKIKQTNLEKYGVEYSLQNDDVRKKSVATWVKKYGVKNPSQNSDIKIKKYETQKRNNTFHISNPEEYIYNEICEKFPQVERQYYSEKYPFACDFYISEIDLYIEFQGSWTHGKEPYSPENQEHQEILKIWQEKAKTSKFYQKAIEVWTISDVKKRKIAEENNLNWLEFFTLEEFKEWFNELTT